MTEQNSVQQNGGNIIGAGFRVAPQPTECRWYVKIVGDILQVWREDRYEAAMWGPLMEKAYADFAGQFGKYGDGQNGTTTQNPTGYDVIAGGGEANKCYSMFYGNSATNTTVGVNQTPGASQSIVMQNIAAITNIVDFMAHKDSPGPAGGAQRFLQARMSPDGAISRCKGYLDILRQRRSDNSTSWYSGLTDWIGATHDAEHEKQFAATGMKSLVDACDPLYNAIVAYQSNSTAQASQNVAVAARTVQAPNAFPILWANGDSILTEFRENLGIVINLGTDNGVGQRTLYAAHSYNVKSAAFNNTQGQPVAVTTGNVATVAQQIDAQKSNVVMQNPHAGNEWDEKGTGAPDGANDGTFTLSLDQFLRSTDLLRSATVQQAAQVGDFPTPQPGPGGTQTA
jgi:hypothetical protein